MYSGLLRLVLCMSVYYMHVFPKDLEVSKRINENR